MSGTASQPVRIAIVGFGAVAELYYAPVLSELRKMGEVELSVVFDPDAKRLSKAAALLPGVHTTDEFSAALKAGTDLAIVASPPRFHAQQTIALLEQGAAVLCEKPMATTVAEAEAMVEAANRAGNILAIGLFRRFFPTSRSIYDVVRNQPLGPVTRFEIAEGGAFQWPAQSDSFFRKSSSQGGVLADLGVHVLDLLTWWFGMPEKVAYEDDAMGGLEANCRVELEFSGGVSGVVRLSRDTPLANRTIVECERGWLRCPAAASDQLELGFPGATHAIGGKLISNIDPSGPRSLGTLPARSYGQSFFAQLQDVLSAVRTGTPPFIPGSQGVHSIRLIEQCYAGRRLMTMPWLSDEEWAGALQRSGGEVP